MKTPGINPNTNPLEFQELVPAKKDEFNEIFQNSTNADNPNVFEAEPKPIEQPAGKPNNFYEVLGVNQTASTTEITEAIPAKLGEMTEAAQVLSDPEKRKVYDSGMKSVEQPRTMNNPQLSPYQTPVTPTSGLTNENVQELARRDTRLVAHLVDGLIVITPAFLFLLMAPFLVVAAAESGGDKEVVMFLALLFLFAVILWLAIPVINCILLYQNGQTIGKRLLSIKIVRTDGSRAGLLRIIFLRFLPIVILSNIGSKLWWHGSVFLFDNLLIFQKSRCCLHDLIAGTIVIEATPCGSAHRSAATTLIAAVILFILLAIVSGSIVIIGTTVPISEIATFEHTDYLNHYKVKRAVNYLEELQAPAEQYVLSTKNFPPTAVSLKEETTNEYVAKIDSNPEKFYYQATLPGEYSPTGGKTIRMTYDPDTGRWKCSSGHPNGVDNKYLPQRCKTQ
ncbi:MAG: hypothetical protein DRR08_18065 [Candidatus Parabeggiatoa sp. nov. 2]|nr:MAG: hypothetical protein B6247_00770 [Beggiatoa sp. 4572_84]RKZ57799.1 MAG: hypothetical protein DRR08_18065 [Gammaproteobacteria bacterium]